MCFGYDFPGDDPWNSIPGTNIPKPEEGTPAYERFNRYTPDQYLIAAQRQKAVWDERIAQALTGNRESGKEKDMVRFETVMQLMDEFYENVYGPGGGKTAG